MWTLSLRSSKRSLAASPRAVRGRPSRPPLGSAAEPGGGARRGAARRSPVGCRVPARPAGRRPVGGRRPSAGPWRRRVVLGRGRAGRAPAVRAARGPRRGAGVAPVGRWSVGRRGRRRGLVSRLQGGEALAETAHGTLPRPTGYFFLRPNRPRLAASRRPTPALAARPASCVGRGCMMPVRDGVVGLGPARSGWPWLVALATAVALGSDDRDLHVEDALDVLAARARPPRRPG